MRRALALAAALAPALACFPEFAFSGGAADGGPPDATAGDAGPDGPRGDDASVASDGEAGALATVRHGVIGAGFSHNCVVRDGGVLCWGDNGSGQLGRGDAGAAPWIPAPVSIDGGALGAVEQIAVGGSFACALAGGRVYCWGSNNIGQLGTGDYESHGEPALLDAPRNVAQISAGPGNVCAISAGGDVACWGWSTVAALTSDVLTDIAIKPTPIPSLRGAKRIELGDEFGCAIRADDTVACWGRNDFHQTGQTASQTCMKSGTSVPCVLVPTQVAGLSDVIDLAVGQEHACALERGGAVKCWGGDRFGSLGPDAPRDAGTCSYNQSDAYPAYPCTERPQVLVDGGVRLVRVAANSEGSTSCIAVVDGGVACWGHNGYSELGQGSNDNDSHPRPLTVTTATLGEITRAIDLARGPAHSCAIEADGTVSCWGFDVPPTDGIFGSLDAAVAPRAVRVPL